MTLMVELDPIGPDGKPTSTTVWCPGCEAIYRVPFEQRYSWRCPCRLAEQAKANLQIAKIYDVPPIDFAFLQPYTCEWVRVNATTGKRITKLELLAAQLEARKRKR